MVSKKPVVPKCPRRTQVANACVNCRTSKVKCSGNHPECSRCKARGIECNFDVSAEGITKRQHLRNELALLAGQKEDIERANAVIDILQHGSDSEAVELLVCLRIGHSVEAAYDHMQKKRQGTDSNLPNQAPSPTTTAGASNTTPSRPPHQANDESAQQLSASTAVRQALQSPQVTPWTYPQASSSVSERPSGFTATSDQTTAWPYPPTSNEPQYFQQGNVINTYTCQQQVEDDTQAHYFGLATPVSPLPTCAPSMTANAQESYIRQPYSREHLFFESTPRNAMNQALYNKPS